MWLYVVYINDDVLTQFVWLTQTNMATPPGSPPNSDMSLEATSKKTRLSTRLRSLTVWGLDQPWPMVNVNPTTGKGSSPQKEKFHSYLGVVACEKIPIIHSSVNDVP